MQPAVAMRGRPRLTCIDTYKKCYFKKIVAYLMDPSDFDDSLYHSKATSKS